MCESPHSARSVCDLPSRVNGIFSCVCARWFVEHVAIIRIPSWLSCSVTYFLSYVRNVASPLSRLGFTRSVSVAPTSPSRSAFTVPARISMPSISSPLRHQPYRRSVPVPLHRRLSFASPVLCLHNSNLICYLPVSAIVLRLSHHIVIVLILSVLVWWTSSSFPHQVCTSSPQVFTSICILPEPTHQHIRTILDILCLLIYFGL